MRRTVLVAATPLALACSPPVAPVAVRPPPPPAASAPSPPAAASPPPREWPARLAEAMAPHGPPHASPASLAVDAEGHARWLTFVGPPETALGAFRVDGATAEPVERWPSAVRVVGEVLADDVAYVLLETVGALDQPAGLRGVWLDAGKKRSPFEGSPMAFADVHTVTELSDRVSHPPDLGSPERNATSLLATLRAASTSPATLAHALASEGADVGVVWQSLFVQPTSHLEPQTVAPSPVADHALAIVRGALETQACGADACEAWPEGGHAVVRFVVQGGRWVIRWILEDAPLPATTPAAQHAAIEPAKEPATTSAVLRARGGDVRVLGEAPLTPVGGTIGVGFTDAAPGTPVVAVTEGGAARTFVMDAVALRRTWSETRWDAAFADVDGDGRTDVVLRLERTEGGARAAWSQAFLAPPPSVQATSLRPDLATALAAMDAPDVDAAAKAAVAVPARAIAREEACRLLAAASTPAGFRKAATPEARVLRFDQPGMPTWLPKIVPAAKVMPDDVRNLAAHCAELSCSTTRPYCSWSAGTDSQHVWFGWRSGDLAIAGLANYEGE